MSLKVLTDKVAGVIKSIHKMQKARVYVGIPESENNRSDGKIGNAGIGYVQEFGSPAQNIPARPFLVTGINAIKDEVSEMLADAAKIALDEKSITVALTKAGIKATNSVKATITKGEGFEALSDATIKARQRKGFKGTKPLIRTGQLRNSINYIVKEA